MGWKSSRRGLGFLQTFYCPKGRILKLQEIKIDFFFQPAWSIYSSLITFSPKGLAECSRIQQAWLLEIKNEGAEDVDTNRAIKNSCNMLGAWGHFYDCFSHVIKTTNQFLWWGGGGGGLGRAVWVCAREEAFASENKHYLRLFLWVCVFLTTWRRLW